MFASDMENWLAGNGALPEPFCLRGRAYQPQARPNSRPTTMDGLCRVKPIGNRANRSRSQLTTPVLRSPLSPRRYRRGRVLGEGAFGVVRKAWHPRTQAVVAIKEIDLSEVSTDYARREYSVLENLKHENVVNVIDAKQYGQSFRVVMEYVEGQTMQAKLKRDGPISEVRCRDWFKQILSGLAYCHQHGVCHRDLKPSNIMVTRDGTIKLIDFGLGKKLRGHDLADSCCGTPGYMAPEVQRHQSPYNAKMADTWELGITFFKMLTGRHPPGDTCEEQIIDLSGMSHSYGLSRDCIDFLSRMLRIDPTKRETAVSLLRHPWFRDAHQR